MDKKSKILFSLFGILIVLSVSASYYRFMVLHDYIIEAQVDCNPSSESCFVWECDPSIEGECTGNPDKDTWYFKIAHRNAKNITACEEGDELCAPFSCPLEGEEECDEVLCNADSLTEYNIDNECAIQSDSPVEAEEEVLEEKTLSEEESSDKSITTDEVTEE